MNVKKAFVLVVISLGWVSLAVPSWAAESAAELGNAGLGMSGLARLISGNIGRFLVLRSELDVTPAQRHQIRGLVKSHREEIAPVAKAVFEKRRALRDAVLRKPVDEQAIRAAANDLGKAIGDAAVVASKVVTKAKGVLTQEQLEKIEQFKTSCRKAENDWVERIGK